MFSLISNYLWQPSTTLTKKYGWNKDSYTPDELLSRKSFTSYRNDIHHPMLNSIQTIDLRDKCPPIYDQGQLGSCTANAICGAYEFEMLKQSEKYIPMSRLMLYYLERSLEGDIDKDSGAQIKDGISVIEDSGLCLENLWQYDISKFAEKPPQNCYDDLKYHKAIRALRVNQTENDIKQCLLEGYPIVFGFTVYQSFENPTVAQTGIVPMPKTSAEQILGGHAVVIVGLTQMNNQNYYIVRNSWGTSWGDHGYCYMPVEYILNSELASDFWSIQLVNDQNDPNEKDIINELRTLLNVDGTTKNSDLIKIMRDNFIFFRLAGKSYNLSHKIK